MWASGGPVWLSHVCFVKGYSRSILSSLGQEENFSSHPMSEALIDKLSLPSKRETWLCTQNAIVICFYCCLMPFRSAQALQEINAGAA